MVQYTYDSWGKVLSVTGSMADTLGLINPFRYRGYYYDSETGLYYLNSRYYDPKKTADQNATDILNKKYGKGKWKKGAKTEHNQIKNGCNAPKAIGRRYWMKLVYKLTHERLVEIDPKTGERITNTKLLGFFSSEDKCHEAVDYYLTQMGFKDYPDDFIIEIVEADIDDYNQASGQFGNYVYFLSHEYFDGEYDYISDLGYYSTRQKAKKAMERNLKEPDFLNHKDGFCIDKYLINEKEWQEGFFLT